MDPIGTQSHFQSDIPVKKGPDVQVPPPSDLNPKPAPVCVHNTKEKKRCYFPMRSPLDDIDEIFIEMGEGGIVVGQPDKGPFDATPEGKQKILDIIKNQGCCELIFAGHRGGPTKNPGGICSKSDKGDVIPLFPDDTFEKQVQAILKDKCPNGCDVFQYSCGGNDPDPEKTNCIREDIAKDLGCTFWAIETGTSPGICYRKQRTKGCARNYSFNPNDWDPNPLGKFCLPFPMVPYPRPNAK